MPSGSSRSYQQTADRGTGGMGGGGVRSELYQPYKYGSSSPYQPYLGGPASQFQPYLGGQASQFQPYLDDQFDDDWQPRRRPMVGILPGVGARTVQPVDPFEQLMDSGIARPSMVVQQTAVRSRGNAPEEQEKRGRPSVAFTVEDLFSSKDTGDANNNILRMVLEEVVGPLSLY